MFSLSDLEVAHIGEVSGCRAFGRSATPGKCGCDSGARRLQPAQDQGAAGNRPRAEQSEHEGDPAERRQGLLRRARSAWRVPSRRWPRRKAGQQLGWTWTGSQLLLAAVMLVTILRPLVLPERFAGRRPGVSG